MGKTSNINRRNFLKILGGSALSAVAFTNCSPSQKQNILTSKKENGSMTYRTNPSNGDVVSLLGYGCMRWPNTKDNDTGEEIIDQEAVNKLVDYAIEHGVNYFDTSPAYCKGFSERATGIALKRHDRNKFFIATKLSNFSPDTWNYDASIGMYQNSFKELQVDCIDYLLLHGIGMGGVPNFNARYVDNGVLDFLLEERKIGRIRNLGFSFHGDIEVFDYLLENNDKYNWDFVQIQLNYVDWQNAKEVNARNTSAEYLYNELKKRNIPAVIMEPLLGGRLAKLNDSLTKKLKEQRPDDSIASWAFRFAGTPDGILTVLSGMTYMEHLQDNVQTYSPLEPCTESENKLLAEVADLMLHHPTIPCTGCQYCMPCPYGLDIPSIFDHYNKCIDQGNMPIGNHNEEYKRARKAYLVGYDRKVPRLRQADHCIGCNQCKPHCPQTIDIPKQMHRIDNFVEELRRNDADLGSAIIGAQLLRQLDEGRFSCIVENNGDIHTFKQKGVRDLYDLVSNSNSILKQARVADKIVGKGAAALIIRGGATSVYTHSISKSALEMLKNNNIHVSYDNVIEYIINNAGTDMCPLEKRVLDCKTADECWPIIQQFINDLNAGLI